jgi:hypothetical protein
LPTDTIPTFYKCVCAHCGGLIDYQAHQAGQVVVCPKCKQKSELPPATRLGMLQFAGPPIPTFKNCPRCNGQMRFIDKTCPGCAIIRKRRWLCLWIVLAVLAIALLAGTAWVAIRHFQKPPEPPKTGPDVLTQPAVDNYLGTNELLPGRFVIQQRRGSDLLIAVGDIVNVSKKAHSHIRADLNVLDRNGKKIGTVSDYMNGLAPGEIWHFNARITDTNAVSLTFARFHEEKY